MKIIPAKTPGFVKALFPNLIWNITTNRKLVYLTFDDGPTPEVTEWVLNQLNTYNAKATFFCIGNNIEKYPEIFNRIITKGHTIGNHTYNHLKGWKHKTKNYILNIEKTQNLINTKLQKQNSKKQKASNCDLEFKNENLKIFRPPYGKFKAKQSKQLQKLGYKIIMWDVLSYDWDDAINEDACLKNVTSKVKNGSIVVFHDSVKASRNLKHVLPKVLDYYSRRGFEFKALTFSKTT